LSITCVALVNTPEIDDSMKRAIDGREPRYVPLADPR
jgi:hypothetical protein